MKNIASFNCLYRLFGIMVVGVILAGCGLQEENTEREAGKRGEESERAEGRTVLTVAVPCEDAAFAGQVSAFNESSDSYYVEIKQYEQEEPGQDMLISFSTHLAREILAGKGPDIVNFSGGYYSPADVSGKLLENLYSYMEEDEDFCIQDYYENILEAFEMSGGLYVMPTSFQINTLCGKAEELGADSGVTDAWEMNEMIAAFQNSPHGEWMMANHSQSLVLGEICSGCMDNFVDWETGKCRFNTLEFERLLEFADTCPEQLLIANDFSLQETLESGKIFLQPVILTSPWRITDWRISFGNARLRWPGYPVADGQKGLGGGIAEICGQGLSICANSANKDGAWEFLKFFLTPEAQRQERGIPLLKSVSEERILEALMPEYELIDGEKKEKVRHEVIFEGDEPIGLTAVTEEDAEIFRSIIENTHRSSGKDFGLYNIIMEEAGAYFEKGKEASGVADIIQRRAAVYVGERMMQ